ncbi:hypothetical protein [Fretibacter rubidus]
MKRAVTAAGVVLLLIIGVFVWALAQSGPDNAPQDIKTIDLEDTYEK